MTTQQAIEALHALPRMGQGAPGLARMQNCATIWETLKRSCSASTLRARTARAVLRP